VNKDEILSEIKETLYPNLMKEQILLLSPKLLNEVFRDEYKASLSAILDKPKTNRFLNKRALNTLDSLKIKTMKELREATLEDILSAYGCGSRTWSRINDLEHTVERSWSMPVWRVKELLPMWNEIVDTMNERLSRLYYEEL